MTENLPKVNKSAVQAGGQLSLFEKYLTFWVALCILTGIALGKIFPGVARMKQE